MESLGITNATLLKDQTVQIGLLVGLMIIGLTWKLIQTDNFYSGVEIFGFEKNSLTLTQAKMKYMSNAKEILIGGAQKCKSVFQVVTASGPKIVFPSRYTNELKNLKGLSFNGFVEKEMFPYLPGFESSKVTIKSSVIVDTVRIKLTQSLNPVTVALCEETDSAVEHFYGSTGEWNEFKIEKHANNFVARLSTRVFLGSVLCRDEAWLRIAVDFTIKLMTAARALKMWPTVLQPYVHWFVPECKALRRISREARVIIGKELKRRNAEKESLAASETPKSKVSDSLGWMQELSHGQDVDLVGGQLGLTFAAIHTTSDMLTKSLYNLCLYPEYQEALRKEMVTVLNEKGWSKTSLYQMKLVDSFLKETQRHTPGSIATMNRVAAEKIKLQDGTVIPKGAQITIIQDSFFDPSIYPDPEKFDGYRFLKLRSQPGQENHWQFVTTSQEHLGFGHGMHACPGRFFASNELKVALTFLLLKYEWRMDSPKEMPATFQYGSEVIANPQFKISFRRRQEEVDIMSKLEQ